ncbi:MAG: ABC transporter ATP-binding protein [Microbacteriaceae bacterium]|nr:ABC transporter ATP-binding protein [Microbacteriaceae bacterium]
MTGTEPTSTEPTGHTGLRARFRVDRPGFSLDLNLRVFPGTVTAIVGPNGAGKSTALRVLAGLVLPATARVSLNGRVLEDSATGVWRPPADREIGVVFQDYLLFPHLTARDNVAFGLRARGTPKARAAQLAEDWLDRLGIGHRSDALPRQLSGGQAQRVALARALILEPKLLLLDEPLAAIDAELRVAVRAQLAESLHDFGGATVLVTHDPIDAMLLADELIVLESGRITQLGSPLAVAATPATDYVARLVGLNLLRRASGTVTFAPPECRLSRSQPDDSAAVACTVRGVEQLGGRLRVHLATMDTSGSVGYDAHPNDPAPPGQLLIAEVSLQSLFELRPVAPGPDTSAAFAKAGLLATGQPVWLSTNYPDGDKSESRES